MQDMASHQPMDGGVCDGVSISLLNVWEVVSMPHIIAFEHAITTRLL